MYIAFSVHGSLPPFTAKPLGLALTVMSAWLLFIVCCLGTESSQSSDEGFAASYNRAITRAIHKTDSGVPHIPSQLITPGHSAKNQAIATTEGSESESSSGEPQALKEDVTKVGDLLYIPDGKASSVAKRPPQKVPRLSSRKLAQIKVCICMYMQCVTQVIIIIRYPNERRQCFI